MSQSSDDQHKLHNCIGVFSCGTRSSPPSDTEFLGRNGLVTLTAALSTVWLSPPFNPHSPPRLENEKKNKKKNRKEKEEGKPVLNPYGGSSTPIQGHVPFPQKDLAWDASLFVLHHPPFSRRWHHHQSSVHCSSMSRYEQSSRDSERSHAGPELQGCCAERWRWRDQIDHGEEAAHFS